MPKKSTKDLSSKAPICKEPDCFDAASIKGYCRLHFIKALAGKSSEASGQDEDKNGSRDRRRSDRFKGLETPIAEEGVEPAVLEMVGEIDTDIEDLDLEPAPAPRKKAG
jgi:hypothetical protein